MLSLDANSTAESRSWTYTSAPCSSIEVSFELGIRFHQMLRYSSRETIVDNHGVL